MSLFSDEIMKNIREKWGDDVFDSPPEFTPLRQEGQRLTFIPGKNRHTVRCSIGEPVYGPEFWQYHNPIPWASIVQADSLGTSYRHLRVYLLARAMFDAMNCNYMHRPLTLCRFDSDYVRVTSQDFNGILRDLASARLIQLEQHTGRKSRIRAFTSPDKHKVGRWKTCRKLWFPPISHISTELPAVSVLAYLFCTLHLTKGTNVAALPVAMGGWVKSRQELYRGLGALEDAGIIRRQKCRVYEMPVLGGPNLDVEIRLGAVPKPPKPDEMD